MDFRTTETNMTRTIVYKNTVLFIIKISQWCMSRHVDNVQITRHKQELHILHVHEYSAGIQHKVQVGMCVQWRFKSVCASKQSEQSLTFPHEETLDPSLPIKRQSKTQIRLHKCAIWSESSMGTHASLYLSSGYRFKYGLATTQLNKWPSYTYESTVQCTLTGLIYEYRGSYTSDHFIWNLWNVPLASLINLIWIDHECKILFIIWPFKCDFIECKILLIIWPFKCDFISFKVWLF